MADSQTSIGGRIDYKFTEKHSLTARYERQRSRLTNAGAGGYQRKKCVAHSHAISITRP